MLLTRLAPPKRVALVASRPMFPVLRRSGGIAVMRPLDTGTTAQLRSKS